MTAGAGERVRRRNTRLSAGLDLLLVHGLEAGYDSGLDAGRAASVLATGTGSKPTAELISATTVPLPPVKDDTPDPAAKRRTTRRPQPHRFMTSG